MALQRSFRALAVALLVAVPAVCAAQSYDQLLKAVNEDDAKTVGDLLNKGLDPDTADKDGNTILMTASRLGYADLVTLLIERDAKVNRQSPHGDTALMFACLKGHLAVAKLLVSNGAKISQPGWAPLHYAAFEGHADVIKYLLEKGADKNSLGPERLQPPHARRPRQPCGGRAHPSLCGRRHVHQGPQGRDSPGNGQHTGQEGAGRPA